MQHLFIDAIGGVAGDMFAAAMLDARPDLTAELFDALARAGLSEIANVRAEPYTDGTLTGTRFLTAPADAGDHDRMHHGHDHAHGHSHEHGHHAHPGHHHHHGDHRGDHQGDHEGDHQEHGHRRHAEIVRWLHQVALAGAVRDRALDIFAHLARAEAEVHGIPVDEVSFHEVGAWDSIADVVTAAWLIEAYGAARWHYAPLPLGRGRVATAHGALPVPAPATALLLEGFAVFQDDLDGERITPTGAAILKHLAPSAAPMAATVRLVSTGTGFGTKRFPGISNVLRIGRYRPEAEISAPHRPVPQTANANAHHTLGASTTETIGVCEFEVDDQSPEDLAHGLERLRALPEVLDVLQMPAFGKKGRMLTHIQILTSSAGLERVVEAALVQTSSLGVRWRTTSRTVLGRAHETVALDVGPVRVKRVSRPGGALTAKVESDDLSSLGATAAARAEVRRAAEARALATAAPPQVDRDTDLESGESRS